jgi:hypothetical protein
MIIPVNIKNNANIQFIALDCKNLILLPMDETNDPRNKNQQAVATGKYITNK